MDEKAQKSTRAKCKRATSYDVAELAGVSQSAVSRVFQDGASASKQMRKRVMAAASKLGYRPNAIARGLITQRSNMVAVIMSQQTNLYYPEVLVQLTQRFSNHRIRVLLFTLKSEGDIDSTLEQVMRFRVDGIVTAANDVMAIGCIDEARESFGLKVPGDVSIVGFDGVGPAQYAAYDLSTVRQPVERMTEAAVSMLIDRIENPELSAEKRVFSGERIRGGSAEFAAGSG